MWTFTFTGEGLDGLLTTKQYHQRGAGQIYALRAVIPRVMEELKSARMTEVPSRYLQTISTRRRR